MFIVRMDPVCVRFSHAFFWGAFFFRGLFSGGLFSGGIFPVTLYHNSAITRQNTSKVVPQTQANLRADPRV